MTQTIKPCFTVSVSPPQLPPIFGGLSATISIGLSVPPLAIPCCPLSIPLSPLPSLPLTIPGLNMAIATLNAALNSAFSSLSQIQIPTCPK